MHLQGPTLLRRGLCNMASRFQVLFCGEAFAGSRIFTQQELQEDAEIEVTHCKQEQLRQFIGTAAVVVPLMARLDAAMLDAASKCRLVLQYGVGVEGVDIPAATARGIYVSNIPSRPTGNALSCAEHAIYLALATLRDQNEMAASVQQRRLGWPYGQTLFGRNVLIIGFGNIARELIPRLKPFGVSISAVRGGPWGRSASPEDAAAEAVLVVRGGPDELLSLAGKADIVILTCAQTERTKGLVDRRFLDACKPGVRIINVARGGLLDYESVREGLDSGRIGGLGLDVQWHEPVDPEDPVSKHPRVVLTPHIAGVTELSYRNMAKVVAREARLALQGLPPTIQLNAPPSPRR